jgi:hypothetical protein
VVLSFGQGSGVRGQAVRLVSFTAFGDHQNVASDRIFQLRVELAHIALASGLSANANGDILLPIHGLADGIAGHRSAEKDAVLKSKMEKCPELKNPGTDRVHILYVLPG